MPKIYIKNGFFFTGNKKPKYINFLAVAIAYFLTFCNTL